MDEQENIVLKHVNQQRALIGGAPLDHLPSQAELAKWQAADEAEAISFW